LLDFFRPAPSTPGERPINVAVGDFNADGKRDLAVANANSNTVSILLGNGDGTFKTHVDYSAGTGPTAIAVGDLNGDGKLDLVVADGGGDNISILLGNGDGTFGAATHYSTGKTPNSVAIGDLNADGIPDLVVADEGGTSVSVLIGLGEGSFKAQVKYTVGTNPISVTLGDFNADGFLDIAAANYGSNNASILLNNHDGTFGSATNYSVGLSPYQVAAADLNRDGTLDLAVVAFDDTISVLLGNGNGSFKTAVSYSTRQNGSDGLAVADFNRDGIPDLLSSDFYSNTATLLLGNGDGTFQSAYSYAIGNKPNAVAVADLNGDGSPDVISANNLSPSSINNTNGNITVVLGNGDGTLRAGRAYLTGDQTHGNNAAALVSADFNRDGIPDIVTSNFGTSDDLSVLLGNGDGTFKSPVNYSGGAFVGYLTTADFNHDSFLDLAVVDPVNNYVNILKGNGDGTFATPIAYSAGSSPGPIAAGDLDGDGNQDLALGYGSGGTTHFGSVAVMFGNGDGSFQTPTTFYGTSGSDPGAVRIGDVSGDGLLDLVAAANGFVGVPGANVFLATGNGNFAKEVTYRNATQATDIAIGDFNNDGKPDLVVTNQTSSNVSVFLNQGSGTFGSGVTYAGGSQNYFLALADYNGDGKLDILFADVTGEVNLLLGNGDGTFQPATIYEPAAPGYIVARDFNNDGAMDLAIGNDTNLVIVLNNRGTKVTLKSSANPSRAGQSVTFTSTVTASLQGLPSPTGQVTFKDGATKLASVTLVGSTASYTTSSLSAGTHKITATYGGDANFNSHVSPTLNQKVTH
jgi:hypothetical protein